MLSLPPYGGEVGTKATYKQGSPSLPVSMVLHKQFIKSVIKYNNSQQNYPLLLKIIPAKYPFWVIRYAQYFWKSLWFFFCCRNINFFTKVLVLNNVNQWWYGWELGVCEHRGKGSSNNCLLLTGGVGIQKDLKQTNIIDNHP